MARRKGPARKISVKKVGLKPAIAFVQNPTDFNLDTEAATDNIVHIKVNVDRLGNKSNRTNITTKIFDEIQTFSQNGATVISTIKSLNYYIYTHEGLTSPPDV